MRAKATIVNLLLVGLLCAGCATVAPPDFRSRPNVGEEVKKIKTVVILPPRVDVVELAAGGVREKKDEWSDEAKKNVRAAIEESLKGGSGLLITPFSGDSLPQEVEANLEETLALFDAVEASILLHTYGPPNQRFSEKVSNFDYSLGQEVEGLARGGADALLLAKGIYQTPTAGRKALQAGAMAAGIALGVLMGVVVIPTGGSEELTAISIALVDARTGSLLWYDVRRSAGGPDLRDPAKASGFVGSLLTHFPVR